MTPDALESAPLLARGELWCLVSAAFVDPYHRERTALLDDRELRGRVHRAAAFLLAEDPSGDMGPGEVRPGRLSPERLYSAFDSEREDLESTYRRLFGLTAISGACPPCEIEYVLNPDVTYRSQQMADVAGFYRAFGMKVSPRASERIDHVTVEAEFLYLLSCKEATARLRRERDRAQVCADARGKYFRDHLGWWLPSFCRVLSRVTASGYYRALAELTAAVATLERWSLGLPPFPSVAPNASKTPAEASCFGCV